MAVFVIVFGGLFMMTLMIDFVEMLRRTANLKDVSLLQTARITLYRVPHITERTLPFTALVSSMVCYLSLTRRHELVVARAAGVSAWQFVMPSVAIAFLIGVFGTTLYNPISATLREHAQRLDAEMFGGSRSINRAERGFWVRQRSPDGQSIINAKGSRLQGVELSNVTIFTLDHSTDFRANRGQRATLYEGYWRLEDARISPKARLRRIMRLRPQDQHHARAGPRILRHPETVPFWHLYTSSDLPTMRASPPSAIAYNTISCWHSLSTCGDGSARCVGEPAAVPFRRRSEVDFRWHFRRFFALRIVEGDRDQVRQTS